MNNAIIQDNKIFIADSISKHGGKMAGIPSISTSCLCNEFCQSMQKCGGTVCQHCYSKKYLSMRKTLREKTARNTEFYTKTELIPEDIPKINSQVFRFESFGEIQNERQLKNYCEIVWNNPDCQFAIWTKNHVLINDYFTPNARPENLNIIISSPYVNKSIKEELIDLYGDGHESIAMENIDAVFTVYSKEYARDNNIEINCGSKKCIDCGLCYSKNLQSSGRIIDVNEILK